MTENERQSFAALATLIVLQVIMLSALYAGVRPHPPVATPLFGIAPFLGASVSVALAAMIVGPLRGRPGRGLSVLAALMALDLFWAAEVFRRAVCLDLACGGSGADRGVGDLCPCSWCPAQGGPLSKRRGRVMAGLLVVMSMLALVSIGGIFGFFYAWVCSTMWGLDASDPRVAMQAMQAMNLVGAQRRILSGVLRNTGDPWGDVVYRHAL